MTIGSFFYTPTKKCGRILSSPLRPSVIPSVRTSFFPTNYNTREQFLPRVKSALHCCQWMIMISIHCLFLSHHFPCPSTSKLLDNVLPKDKIIPVIWVVLNASIHLHAIYPQFNLWHNLTPLFCMRVARHESPIHQHKLTLFLFYLFSSFMILRMWGRALDH